MRQLASVCCVLVWAQAWLSSVQAATPPPNSVQLRIGSLATPGTPWMEDLETYKRDLNEASHGLLKVKIVQAASMSTEPNIINACQQGNTFQMIGVSSAALVDIIPALEVLELPFLFESVAETDYVLDNYLTEAVRKLMRAKGLEFYTWAENGWFNIATRDRLVKTPKDLVGMRMRSQPSAMHIMAWQTYGAAPIPTPLSGILPGITSGDVAGFAQTSLITSALGLQKSIQYYTVLHYIYQPLIMAYSKTFYDAQPEHIQKLLMERAAKYAALDRRQVRALEDPIVQQFRQAGVEIYTPTDKERGAFMEASHRIHDKFVNTAPPEALALLKLVVQGKAAFQKQKQKH